MLCSFPYLGAINRTTDRSTLIFNSRRPINFDIFPDRCLRLERFFVFRNGSFIPRQKTRMKTKNLKVSWHELDNDFRSSS